ncbi:MAG TPA: hypothetical protein VMV49_08240 [Candidatus Deferrimicrobium sp.]|nr:hypothetical protein [Candidatus Deferrimicrobium sp.]
MAVPLKLRLFSTIKLEKPIYTIAAADLDGDGKIEIITGAGDAFIRIFKYEKGKFEEVWDIKHWTWIDQIFISDIDQDLINEIFIVTGRNLSIYKYIEPTYKKVWEYEANTTITSVFVGDASNNNQNELLIGTNDGTLIVFAQDEEEALKFTTIWKKTKLEGDVLVTVADVDADKLNEIVVASSNVIRVFRVIHKYPKKESWMEQFKPFIKKIYCFDLNSDKKAEIFLGMEDGRLAIYSHKDGDYFSEDSFYNFKNLISTISSGTIQDRKLLIVGSYDKTVRAFKSDAELFQIEMEEKIYSTAFADIDHDGKPELLCTVGSTLYIFKEDVFLAFQMDYPISIHSDEEFKINYFIKNNTNLRIYNIDFTNLEWTPNILTLNGPKPKIPVIDTNSSIEISLKFTPTSIQKVTSVVFPPFKVDFELNNQKYTQVISEIELNLLPIFSTLARIILSLCENYKGTKVPLKTLVKLLEKDVGSLEYDIERIISQLLDEKLIIGTIANKILTITDVKPYQEDISTVSKAELADQKLLAPHLFMNALKMAIQRKKRTLLSELVSQFNRDQQEIQETLNKLKANFEITGVLIPNEEFYYISPDQLDAFIKLINETPYIPLSELEQHFALSERVVRFLLDDLNKSGKLYGQIFTKEGVNRFITIDALAENLLHSLQENGKMPILSYSRKTGISAETIREGIRVLLDSNKIHGYYTFNGAIFYMDAQLEKDLTETIIKAETSNLGILSLAKQFQLSKDDLSIVLNNLISKKLINGYISENTLYLKSVDEEKLRDVYGKYIDALNVAHILVIHQESGIAIFSESYTPEKIDSLLISGFLHAISSFGSEIPGMSGASLRTLEYQNFKISVEEGSYIRAALILKEEPSQRLLENLKYFIRFFDKNYQTALQNFKGSMEPFSNAGSLVDDFFEVSLSLSHEVQEKEVFKNRDRLSANELMAINLARSLGHQFSLSQLLERITRELLISQVEAFSIIYILKEKKIFNVISEERKWCPYCGSIIPKSVVSCPFCKKDIE